MFKWYLRFWAHDGIDFKEEQLRGRKQLPKLECFVIILIGTVIDILFNRSFVDRVPPQPNIARPNKTH